MAIESEGTGNGFYMPVAPAYAGNNNGGFGGWGDGGWWILLLFILLGNGNWGNNGGGFGGGMGGLYPWMNQAQLTTDGFQNSLMNDNITSIRDGVFGLSTQLCNSFSQAEIADNARQMANMQQMFGLQSALQDCCCENRLATANQTATILAENCADRAAISNGVRDIIESGNRNNQAILDKLCQLELSGKQDRINDLERQLTMANLSASQIAQTATIQRGQTAEVDALYQRLRDCPVPTMPVYGMQPIFTCPTNNSGCGCGCNGGNF